MGQSPRAAKPHQGATAPLPPPSAAPGSVQGGPQRQRHVHGERPSGLRRPRGASSAAIGHGPAVPGQPRARPWHPGNTSSRPSYVVATPLYLSACPFLPQGVGRDGVAANSLEANSVAQLARPRREKAKSEFKALRLMAAPALPSVALFGRGGGWAGLRCAGAPFARPATPPPLAAAAS